MKRDEELVGGAISRGEGVALRFGVLLAGRRVGRCYLLTTSIMRPAPFAWGPGSFNLAADWSSVRRMRGAAAAVGILILSPRAGGLPRPSPGCREANKKKHKQKSTKKKGGKQKTHTHTHILFTG